MTNDKTPAEWLLLDTAKRMRRIFDAEPEANAIDCGREAIRIVCDILNENSSGDLAYALGESLRDRIVALVARCAEGTR